MNKHRKAITAAIAVLLLGGLIAALMAPVAASAATPWSTAAPQNVHAVYRQNVNETAITWSRPATSKSVSGYIVSLTVSSTGKTDLKALPATARVASFGGIPAGSSFKVSVKARYGASVSAYVSGGVLRSSSVPLPVTAPGVTASGPSGLTATWSAPASDDPIISYLVTVWSDTGAQVASAVIPATGRQYTATALAAGHSYTVRVQARSIVGLGSLGSPSAPVAVAAAVTTPAATPAVFQAGNIISDANFYQGDAMTASGVQSFLNAKVPVCQSISSNGCLKDFRQDTRAIAAGSTGTCQAITAGVAQSAAQIITTVASACGISPKTLLVLIQKEQSLVTSTNPSTRAFDYATGWGCPDTAGCQTAYTGLFNQLYRAALQLKIYGTSSYFNWYPVGKTSNIGFNPNSSCGSSAVFIKNKATAALYYYTPYQPNAAALANPYGTGDACSSYGNRNFFNLFRDWFGSPT